VNQLRKPYRRSDVTESGAVERRFAEVGPAHPFQRSDVPESGAFERRFGEVGPGPAPRRIGWLAE
jgi:hypothetical protein